MSMMTRRLSRSTTRTTPQPLGVGGTWSLIFQDEFTGSSLDTTHWRNLRGAGGYYYGGPFNVDYEDAAFSADYASVENGNLRLRWDNTPIVEGGVTYPYTSAVATTEAGMSYLYGYCEARIWFTETPGMWPAFWLVPIDNTWPPEIDIAEFVTADTPDGLYHPHFNVHWTTNGTDHLQMGWQSYGASGTSFAGAWHTYGFLWQPGFAQVYLDGVAGPSFSSSNVPTKAMYIILNASIEKGGTPANGNMLVDYVRVWQ